MPSLIEERMLESLDRTVEMDELLREELPEDSIELSLPELLDDSHQEVKLTKLYHDSPYAQRLRARILQAAEIGRQVEAGEARVCESCGDLVRIGEWPFCDTRREGLYEGIRHGRVRPRNALTSQPTVLYFNPRTKKIWVPGRNDRRPPKGYARQEYAYSDRKRLYGLLDRQAKDVYEKRIEREEQIFGPLLAENRKQLRIDCKTPELIAHAIAKTEKAQHDKLKYEPNTVVEAWEWNERGGGLDDARNPDNEHLEKVQPKAFKPKQGGRDVEKSERKRERKEKARAAR